MPNKPTITVPGRRWAAAVGVALAITGGVLVAVRTDDPLASPSTSTLPAVSGTSATASPTTATQTSSNGHAASTAPTTGRTTTSRLTTTHTTTQPAPAPPFPPSLRGQDVTVLPTTAKVVALTFDGGAGSQGLDPILRALASRGVRATFFVTGAWAQANPSRLASIRAAGHRVGNHSMTHPAFTGLTDQQIHTQLADAERAIRAAGADPRPLFRFPEGARDARTIAAVNAANYLPVRWTVDSLGWKGTTKGGMTAAAVRDRVLGALRPGAIVLMHIGANPDDSTILDADALPEIIERMRAAGYTFTTLDTLLGG